MGSSKVKVTVSVSISSARERVSVVVSSQSPYSMEPSPETGGTDALFVFPVVGPVTLLYHLTKLPPPVKSIQKPKASESAEFPPKTI
jgi:hypothetical protein